MTTIDDNISSFIASSPWKDCCDFNWQLLLAFLALNQWVGISMAEWHFVKLDNFIAQTHAQKAIFQVCHNTELIHTLFAVTCKDIYSDWNVSWQCMIWKEFTHFCLAFTVWRHVRIIFPFKNTSFLSAGICNSSLYIAGFDKNEICICISIYNSFTSHKALQNQDGHDIKTPFIMIHKPKLETDLLKKLTSQPTE